MASSLRRERTKTIGTVVSNLANAFFSRLVTNWEALSARAGYETLVVASQDEVETEARRIQSVMLTVWSSRQRGAAGASFRPPADGVGGQRIGWTFDTVSSGNFEAGQIGARHLLSVGHRDIPVLRFADTHLHLRNASTVVGTP